MPTIAVLLVVAFFGTGLLLLAVPVTATRLRRFASAHSLDPEPAQRARWWSYLAAQRRVRVAGVLIAAAISLSGSLPEQRVDFALVPLLAGWFAAAVAVEQYQRAAGLRVIAGERVRYWWDSFPVATAVGAVVWTAAALWWRGAGVAVGSLLPWGFGALVTMLVVLVVARPDTATSPAALRGLRLGGILLSLSCLAQLWLRAVPGPYDKAHELYPVVWAVAIGAVMLALATSPPSTVGLGRLLAGYAVVAVLPLAFAVPVKLSQQPPQSVAETGAVARIRIARLDQLPAAQAELGLKADPPMAAVPDPAALPTELVGRVDLARPAPAGTAYQLFAFDRRNGAAVPVYGAGGGAWYGFWSTVLPERYPWLARVFETRDAQGFNREPMAVSPDPASGVLWLRAGYLGDSGLSAADLQLVLMLVRRHDAYVYWAAPVPV